MSAAFDPQMVTWSIPVVWIGLSGLSAVIGASLMGQTRRPDRKTRAEPAQSSSVVLISADRPWAISMSVELLSVQAVRSVTASMTSRALG